MTNNSLIRKIPKSAKLLKGTNTANFQVYSLREHLWIKIRGDVIFITIRRKNLYPAHIRARDFEAYTNGSLK